MRLSKTKSIGSGSDQKSQATGKAIGKTGMGIGLQLSTLYMKISTQLKLNYYSFELQFDQSSYIPKHAKF